MLRCLVLAALISFGVSSAFATSGGVSKKDLCHTPSGGDTPHYHVPGTWEVAGDCIRRKGQPTIHLQQVIDDTELNAERVKTQTLEKHISDLRQLNNEYRGNIAQLEQRLARQQAELREIRNEASQLHREIGGIKSGKRICETEYDLVNAALGAWFNRGLEEASKSLLTCLRLHR